MFIYQNASNVKMFAIPENEPALLVQDLLWTSDEVHCTLDIWPPSEHSNHYQKPENMSFHIGIIHRLWFCLYFIPPFRIITSVHRYTDVNQLKIYWLLGSIDHYLLYTSKQNANSYAFNSTLSKFSKVLNNLYLPRGSSSPILLTDKHNYLLDNVFNWGKMWCKPFVTHLFFLEWKTDF